MQLDCGDPNAKVNLPSRGLWYIPHNKCSSKLQEPKLNLYTSEPSDTNSSTVSSNSPQSQTQASQWVRVTVRALATIAGVGLAIGVGNLHGHMALSVTRSPLIIAATTFIRENLHPLLFAWEQELLAHLALTPYFLLYAIGFGLLLSPNSSKGLLMLPIAYAVVLAPLLLLSAGYFESMGLRWYHMIPTALYFFSYIPITQIGINIAGHIRSKSIGVLLRSFAFVSVFVITMLCIAFVPVKSIQPILLLIVLCVLAYMTREPIGAVTNHPMDRSGGSAAS